MRPCIAKSSFTKPAIQSIMHHTCPKVKQRERPRLSHESVDCVAVVALEAEAP